MKQPTAAQIKAEIAALKKLKPKVRRRTAFGDDNWKAIDAEIAVLAENLSDNRIYDRFTPRDEETGDEDPDGNRHELDAALETRRWLDGESSDGKPSKGWVGLVEKK